MATFTINANAPVLVEFDTTWKVISNLPSYTVGS